jgi:hypothetical protein
MTDPASMMDGRNTTVTCRGIDIWDSTDSFFYSSVTIPETIPGRIFRLEVYTELGFIARSSSHAWAKFGLMVRETLKESAKHFSVFLTPTQGVHAFHRQSESGSTNIITGRYDVRGGGWLLLERSWDTFRAFFRADTDTSYVLIGQATVAMSGSVEAGVALSSHNSAMSETVQFSLFSLEVGSMII